MKQIDVYIEIEFLQPPKQFQAKQKSTAYKVIYLNALRFLYETYND